jgi:hypothetical protein
MKVTNESSKKRIDSTVTQGTKAKMIDLPTPLNVPPAVVDTIHDASEDDSNSVLPSFQKPEDSPPVVVVAPTVSDQISQPVVDSLEAPSLGDSNSAAPLIPAVDPVPAITETPVLAGSSVAVSDSLKLASETEKAIAEDLRLAEEELRTSLEGESSIEGTTSRKTGGNKV